MSRGAAILAWPWVCSSPPPLGGPRARRVSGGFLPFDSSASDPQVTKRRAAEGAGTPAAKRVCGEVGGARGPQRSVFSFLGH